MTNGKLLGLASTPMDASQLVLMPAIATIPGSVLARCDRYHTSK